MRYYEQRRSEWKEESELRRLRVCRLMNYDVTHLLVDTLRLKT